MSTPLLPRVARKLGDLSREARRGVRRVLAPHRGTVPVFVVGCQRSGTTMTVRAFERTSRATVFYEWDRLAFGRDMLLRDPDTVDALIARSGTAVAVFKPMNEIQRIPRWLSRHDGVRIVWLVRRYEDVVNSSVRHFTTMRETLARIVEDPENAGWWGEDVSTENLALVRRFYHPDMSLEDAYAVFWILRNVLYFELGLERVEQVALFDYDDLVTRKRETFARLFSHARCPYDEGCTAEIFTTSVGRNPPPVISPAIREICEDLQARLAQAVSS